jgi:uncharacterized delta-60 repeat protein
MGKAFDVDGFGSLSGNEAFVRIVSMSIQHHFSKRFRAVYSICIAAFFVGWASSFQVFAQAPEIFQVVHPAGRAINGIGGGETLIYGEACVTDSAGNTYVTGSFTGTATFGTNSYSNLGGYGWEDAYLAKYGPDGQVLWSHAFGSDYRESGRALALDGAGGVYLAGYSTGSGITFSQDSVATNIVYGAQNSPTMFLARFDGAGNALWAQRAGLWQPSTFSGITNANVWPSSLAVDASGNLFVAGRFTGNPMVGGELVPSQFSKITYTNGVVLMNKFQTTGTKTEDMFLAKFSPAGSVLWATNYGGTDVDWISGIALDSLGNTYAAGAFNKTTTIGGSTFTNLGYAPFVSKFGPNGAVLWSSSLSEPTNSNPGRAWSVTVDSANRATVAFQTTALTFRLGTNSFTNNLSSPSFSGTVASGAVQFAPDGAVRWLRRLPFNIDGANNAFGLTVVHDRDDNLLFRGYANLWTNTYNLGTRGLIVYKTAADGTPVWTNFVPAILGTSFVDDSANKLQSQPAISLDGLGRISVAGTLTGDKTTVAGIGWTNLTTAFTHGFGYNMYLLRMESNYVAVAPQFVNQPTNLVFQPPSGFTNSALARAWPVAAYRWYMVSNGLAVHIGTNLPFVLPKPTSIAHVASYYCVASNAIQQTTSTVFTAQAQLGLYPLTNYSSTVLLGGSTVFSVNATGTTAFTYQWRKNGTNLTGANASSLLVNYPDAASGTNRYDVIACNDFGCLTSTPPATVMVKPFGALDPTFPGGLVGRQLFVETGGAVLAGGKNLVRYSTAGVVETNGFYDPSPPSPGAVGFFYPANIGGGGPNLAFNRDPDGKIIVGGHFTRLNTNGSTGPALNRMVRFNADGTIDSGFNAGTGPAIAIGFPLDNTYSVLVRAIVRQSDGKYLVGGIFNTFNGVARTNLVRLNSNGSVDLSFQGPVFDTSTSPGAQAGVRAILIRPAGGLLVGHDYRGVGGIYFRPCIVGLTDDGAMDSAFNDNLPVDPSTPNWGSYATGRALALQKDGKILFAGQFGFQVSGASYTRVARFNGNGSLDATFNQTNYINPAVNAVAVAPDGKILFGGDNQPIRRVDANGKNDPSFVSEALFTSSQLEAIAVDGDKIYVTGAFGLYRLLGALPSTTVPGPTFSAGTAVRLPDGKFSFSTCAQAGQTIVIEASTNLVNWVPVATNAVAGDCILFTDSEAPLIPNRFYRVVAP